MRSGAVFLALVLAFGAACGTAPKPPAPASPKAAAPREAPSTTTTTAAGADDAGDDDDDGEEEEAKPEPSAPSAPSPCARNMVIVEQDGKRFCIDKYEAALVEIAPDGAEKPYAHWLPVDGHSVRAVSEPGVHPQGYISEVQAADACIASGKRLCSYPEWKTACMGPKKTTFPYGEARRSGVCNDSGKSAVVAVFGAKAVANSPVNPIIAAANDPARRKGGAETTKARGEKGRTKVATSATPGSPTKKNAAKPKDGKKSGKNKKKDKDKAAKAVAARPAAPSRMPAGVDFNVWTQLNDPRLGQVEGALAKTGEHPDCANGFGVVDMVGNIHEWVATDPSAAHGTFAGGYYLDTSLNGDGCGYKTQAHAHDYHDYSTGFRCCADPKE